MQSFGVQIADVSTLDEGMYCVAFISCMNIM
jgi:hypothetical protein